MDKKNARTPKDDFEEDPLDREEDESPQKNDYSFGVKEPSSKKDIDEEEIDPLDDEDVKDEDSGKEVSELEEDPLEEEDIEKSDQPAHRPTESLNNTEPVEEELDRERTLADLAKEDIESEEDTPQDGEQPFRTNNIDLDTPISKRTNPYFESERQHENIQRPDFSRPNRPQDDFPNEGTDDQNAEIHIPNLRSPRFNQDSSAQMRRPLDQDSDNRGNDIGFGARDSYPNNPFERNSLRNGPQPKRGASKLHLIVLLLIGAAVIGGTVYFLKTQFKPNSQVASETTQATPEPTPEPTPTPEPEANRADFTVKVLNGTTTTGLASKVTDQLKELGYKTEKGANAPKQDYEQTLISVKEGQDILLKTLIKDLSEYEASSGPTLKESDPLDAQIILGKK